MLISLVYDAFFVMAEGGNEIAASLRSYNDRGNKTNSILLINGESV